ncbi:Exosome component 3 [Actinomortierella ambigua]|nr:Exosome component 3 [Actinomortierella ambigua]
MAPKNKKGQADAADGSTSAPTLRVILPGDQLPPHEANLPTGQDEDAVSMMIDQRAPPTIKLGPGLTPMDDDTIISVKAGVLNHTDIGNRWWVESNQRRYVAAPGESVIGIVTGKTGEHYKMDIGTAQPALLPVLAFENATKKNRPNFNIGDLLYCRVAMANKDMEAELDCVNPTTGKSDGFGELKGGFAFKVSLGLARRLLDPRQAVVLRELGKHFPFETAVGMNGKVWINSASTAHTILIANAIKNSEFLSTAQCQSMVKKMVERI